MRITESINKRTNDIDKCETIEMVRMINDEDKSVAFAVEKELQNIALAIDKAALSLQNGGRMFYVGTGTSGRIGVLDASECPPTYGVSEEMVKAILAGGIEGITNAANGDEDSHEAGMKDLQKEGVNKKDVVVGITASGRTPYVIGAINHAKSMGALTIGICNNPDTELSRIADITIVAITGPEVIQGSTRMKAGTAQKMILNMISTGVMVKLGRTCGNIMIDLDANNEKLYGRAENIVCNLTGTNKDTARKALSACEYNIREAVKLIENGDVK